MSGSSKKPDIWLPDRSKRYKASLSPILLQTGLRFCTSVCSPPWHLGIHRTRAKQQVRRALLLRAFCCENRGMGEYRTSAHAVFDIKYHTTRRNKYPLKTNAQRQLQGRIPIAAVLSSHGVVRVFRTWPIRAPPDSPPLIDNRKFLCSMMRPTALRFSLFRNFPGRQRVGRAEGDQNARCTTDLAHTPLAIYYQHHGLCSSKTEPPSRAAVLTVGPPPISKRRNQMLQNVTQIEKIGPSEQAPCSTTRPI